LLGGASVDAAETEEMRVRVIMTEVAIAVSRRMTLASQSSLDASNRTASCSWHAHGPRGTETTSSGLPDRRVRI